MTSETHLESDLRDAVKQGANLLDPGMSLTLRPMRYPQFYEMFRDAIKNTWTVEEIDLHSDLADLHTKLSPAERHLVSRLVAFFATGDTIVANYLGQIWGGDVFDNSYDRGQPLNFQVGVGMVIRGWDDGLVGQRVGSRLLLSIPSELGYGDRGVPQAGIRGGDTLVFVTEILGVM